MKQMKTPGVYIVEKNAFPNSVVAVPTAVPAFIGHTQMAMNGTKSLRNVPFRITSMLEYETYFGGAPNPKFTLSFGSSFKKDEYTIALKTLQEKTQTLKETTQLLEAEIAKGGSKDENKISQYNATIRDCNTAIKAANDTLVFSKKLLLNINNPIWSVAVSGYLSTFYYNLVLFFANGGGACYIVSVGDYSDKLDLKNFTVGIEALKKEQEPTMVIVPEAVNDTKDFWKGITEAALSHCGKMKNRITILDVFLGYKSTKEFVKELGENKDVISYFRESVGSESLDYAAAYYPWIQTSVVSESDMDASYLSNPEELLFILEQEIDWENDAQIANTMHRYQLTKVSADKKDQALLEIAQRDKVTMKEVDASIQEGETLENAIKRVSENTLTDFKDSELIPLVNMLLSSSICGKEIMKKICQSINCLPLAAAMAGIYAHIDDSRGVWKAPANVSISKAVSPTVNITDSEQESLNVDLNGKSINAIRYFKGEGIKVWGARTLLGNSLDWRYINVRRTMIFLEESVKNASKAYVFEPNVASTWMNMKSMIENFLRGVWKQGGLAGASPEDAYSVHVGLGDTMTAEDILEGILRITVLVAISHPAEFIEITFQQQMQKS